MFDLVTNCSNILLTLHFFSLPTFLLSFVWSHGIPQIEAVMLNKLDWTFQKDLIQAYQNTLDSAS